MHLLIATDACPPQVNGVVRTLGAVAQEAARLGVKVEFLTSDGMPTIGVPSYPDIRLALTTSGAIARRIDAINPEVIHIATEGTIGYWTRRYCLSRGRPFTTSFHTRLVDYIVARYPLPASWIWNCLRNYHNAGRAVMAATPSLADELTERGFQSVNLWCRGVDTQLFQPQTGMDLDLPRPIFLSVGRLAIEKNIDAFLQLDLPGSKVVVGDGPAAGSLKRKFPGVVFLGAKQDAVLAQIYSAADVFVFPSRTDTYGLVLLEALASGLPVAGYPVAATNNVIGTAPVGVLDEDLRAACLRALSLSRSDCRAYALTMTWENCARRFLDIIANNNPEARKALQSKAASA